MIKQYFSRGVSLVEVLVAAFVISVAIVALLGAHGLYLRLALGNTAKIESAFLVEEGQEVVRALRDAGWTANIASLTPGTSYYLTFDAGANHWLTTSTNNLIDGVFTRELRVGDAARDSSNNIVGSGGTVDPKIKKITVTVSWSDHGVTASSTAVTYLANLFNN